MIEHVLSHVTFVDIFNGCVFLIFTLCYSYQLYYAFVVLTRTPPSHVAKENHAYAVLIAARNEQTVIADLIKSIRAQNYPQSLIDIFVIADNCTDNTAAIAKAAGATDVFVRFNEQLVGKGYALDFGWKKVRQRYVDNRYEAFFVFDADNVLDANYFREMNKTFDGGAVAATSYRNSKNYDSNWISAGYAIWFLREAKYLNQARLILGTSCAVSGTGFFVRADVLEHSNGWKWHLLTEDIEFSTQSIIEGERISYCPTAVLYDEQPVTFKDSWNQRFRWAKGFYQVFGKYAPELIKGFFSRRRKARLACYDMFMTIAPALLLTVTAVAFNVIIAALTLLGYLSAKTMLTTAAASIFFCLFNYMLFMFAFGALTTYTEWKHIHAPAKKKILYMLTFPLFMITYIPIALAALVKEASWKPIKHTISVDVERFGKASRIPEE